MKLQGPFWLALRFFGSRGGRKKGARPLAGAVIGIALSLIPLTVVTHLAEGMVSGILERFMETWTFHLQAQTFFQTENDEVDAVAESIGTLPGVKSVFVEKQGFGLLYSDTGQSGVTLRGLPANLYETDTGFSSMIKFREGSWDLADKGSVLLGINTARELDVTLGDEITLLTGRVFGQGKFAPKITRFTVKGIFTTGYQELDRTWVIISHSDADRVLSGDNARVLVGAKVNDPWKPVTLARLRDAVLLKLPSGWYVYSWDELAGSYRNNFQTTKGILILIMAMLVLVAVINVASSLVMIVIERSQEIGILKCSGTSPKDISSMFLLIGLLVGVTGAFFGLAGGVFISLFYNQLIGGLEAVINAFIRLADAVLPGDFGTVTLINTSYYLEKVPVRFQLFPVLAIFITTILLSVTVSVIPAGRAGRIRPLDVIRKH